jgi:hypothetical protein
MVQFLKRVYLIFCGVAEGRLRNLIIIKDMGCMVTAEKSVPAFQW